MRTLIIIGVIAIGTLAWILPASTPQAVQDFSPYVGADGTIRLPEDFRTWTFLGTWSIDSDEAAGGAAEFHAVYTQPETAAAYKRTGQFPDGAVLVKELLATDTSDMTTGRASRGTTTKGWFVMVKDSQGRFPDNPLWGDGWGWALFNAGDRTNTVTKDYAAECLGCHVPAQATDWIYVQGYPILSD